MAILKPNINIKDFVIWTNDTVNFIITSPYYPPHLFDRRNITIVDNDVEYHITFNRWRTNPCPYGTAFEIKAESIDTKEVSKDINYSFSTN